MLVRGQSMADFLDDDDEEELEPGGQELSQRKGSKPTAKRKVRRVQCACFGLV